MLKRIPKSDISIRPFKAYKEWSFDQSSIEISLLEAVDGNYSSTGSNILTSGSLIGSEYTKHALFGQLKAQFYNGHEDNPFLRFGSKINEYNNNDATKDRYLSGSAKVISIPQIYVGESIKKKSVALVNGGDRFIDDEYGNLVSDGGGFQLNFTNLDLTGSIFNFTDLSGTPYSSTINSFFIDIENSTLDIVIDGDSFNCDILSMDNELGVIFVLNAAFLKGASTSKIGNVFYSQGIIVLTRNPDSLLTSNWELSFKSTETIYENEYLLIVNQDEFNVSQNPTAVVEEGRETSYVTNTDGKTQKVTTNTGAKYIKKLTKLENGNILDYRFSGSVGNKLAGFEHYDLSGSIDTNGSFLAPFITTIGLYDDNCDLVAVAKLPQPIKSEPDIPVNFIVRFDT